MSDTSGAVPSPNYTSVPVIARSFLDVFIKDGFDGNAATLTYDAEHEGRLLLRLLNKEAPDASAKIFPLSLSTLRVQDLKALLKAKEEQLGRATNGVAWAVDLTKPLGLRMNTDAEVAGCAPGGQADKSGLPLAGKTIVEIDGKEVKNLGELQMLAKQVKEAALLRGDDSPGCVLTACDQELVQKLADDIHRLQFCSFGRPDAFLLELGDTEFTLSAASEPGNSVDGYSNDDNKRVISLWEGGLILDPRDGGHWARMLPRLAQEWAASAAFRTLPTLPGRLQQLAGRPVSRFAPSKSAYALPFALPGEAAPSNAAFEATIGSKTGADNAEGGITRSSSSDGVENPLRGSVDSGMGNKSSKIQSTSTTSSKSSRFFSRKGIGSSKNTPKKRVPTETEASVLARFQDLAATPVQASTHGLLLEDLWTLVSEHFYQDSASVESFKQQLDSEGSSLGWVLIGFQTQSPIHDFKTQGTGLLGLKQLAFFLRRRRHAAHAMLDPLSPCFQLQAPTLEQERNANRKEIGGLSSRRASTKAARASVSRRASTRASITPSNSSSSSQNSPMKKRPSMLKTNSAPDLSAGGSAFPTSAAGAAAAVGVSLDALPPFGLAACGAAKIVAQAFGFVNERTGTLRDFKTTKKAYWHLVADLNDVFCAALSLVHKVWTDTDGDDANRFNKVLTDAKAQLVIALEKAPASVTELEASLALHDGLEGLTDGSLLRSSLSAGATVAAPTTANAAARRRKSLAGAAFSGEIVSTITNIDEEYEDDDDDDIENFRPSVTSAAFDATSEGSNTVDIGEESNSSSYVPIGGWVYSGPSFDKFENLDVVECVRSLPTSAERAQLLEAIGNATTQALVLIELRLRGDMGDVLEAFESAQTRLNVKSACRAIAAAAASQDLFADDAFLELPEDCSRLVTSAKADAKGACWSASSTAAIFAALPPARSSSLLNAFLERGAFRPSVKANNWRVFGHHAAASATMLESVRPDALASMLLQLPTHGARSEILLALEPNKRSGPFQLLDIDCQVRTLAVLPPQARMELLVMSVLWGGDQNLQDAYDTHEQRYGVLSSSSSPSSHQNPSAATSSRAPSPPMSRMLSSSSKSAPSSRPPAEAPPPSPTLTTKFSAKNLFLGGGKARNNSKDEPASSASTKRSNRGSYSLEDLSADMVAGAAAARAAIEASNYEPEIITASVASTTAANNSTTPAGTAASTAVTDEKSTLITTSNSVPAAKPRKRNPSAASKLWSLGGIVDPVFATSAVNHLPETQEPAQSLRPISSLLSLLVPANALPSAAQADNSTPTVVPSALASPNKPKPSRRKSVMFADAESLQRDLPGSSNEESVKNSRIDSNDNNFSNSSDSAN